MMQLSIFRDYVMDNRNALNYVLLTPSSRTRHTLENVIQTTLQESGLEPLSAERNERTGKRRVGESIKHDVKRDIERADVVIADLTGSNPNVMYEVGYAHALQKPVLPIISAKNQIPYALADYQFLVYEQDKPQELSQNLRIWANYYVSVKARKLVNE